MFIHKQIGKFEVSINFINENLKEFMMVMKEVGVVRVEENIIMGKLVYYGISEHFRELSPNEVIPLYEAIFTKSDDGYISLIFDEVGHGRD